MTSISILVITEGATEREVGRVLYEEGLLSRSVRVEPTDWKSTIGSREGYKQVILALKERNPIAPRMHSGSVRALIVFDQEDAASPQSRMEKIQSDLSNNNFWRNLSFQPIDGMDNLFEHKSEQLHIIFHISNASVNGISRKDFDGYILQLLQSSKKREIASHLIPDGQNVDHLLQKAEEEFTRLMSDNGFPWSHNKSWLYAYITAFQYRQSHVWFARDVVESAIKLDRETSKTVFASLISAWERLITGGTP